MTVDAIIIPIKRFDHAKARLRGADLDVDALARTLASGVIRHSAPRQVIVVCEERSIATFARAAGADVWWASATGLNAVIHSAYRGLGDRFERLIVAHGDLRHPEGLGDFAPTASITLVADHRRQGTNVLALPTGLDFHFAYGPNSLDRHVGEARRLGLDCEVVVGSPWGFDVDEPQDLDTTDGTTGL